MWNVFRFDLWSVYLSTTIISLTCVCLWIRFKQLMWKWNQTLHTSVLRDLWPFAWHNYFFFPAHWSSISEAHPHAHVRMCALIFQIKQRNSNIFSRKIQHLCFRARRNPSARCRSAQGRQPRLPVMERSCCWWEKGWGREEKTRAADFRHSTTH